ncbi:MAG: CoA-binding protein [Acidobacteriota bacterium]
MIVNSRGDIEDFWAQKRIAIAGVSRDPGDFTRRVYAALVERGYDVVPVNPGCSEVDGQHCYARVADIPASVDAVVVMTPAGVTSEILQECAARSIRRVWLHGTGGKCKVPAAGVESLRRDGMVVIAGLCPFMFMPQSGFFHRFHGWIEKVSGHVRQ